MPLVRRADELVLGNVERLPGVFEVLDVLVDERLGLDPCFGGGTGDLLSVLVRAGQEKGLIAALPVVPGERVGDDLFVGVSEMRAAIDVINGRRDVEAWQMELLCETG